MVSGKNGARQVVKARIAVFATVTLAITLSIIVAMADHCSAAAFDTPHTIRPAMLANQFKTLCIVNQGR